VENPTKTFPRALAIAVVLVVTMYMGPLLVAIGVSSNSRVDVEYGAFTDNCTLVDADITWRDAVCNQTKEAVAAAYGGKFKYLDPSNNSYFDEDCGGVCGAFVVRCSQCPTTFANTVVKAFEAIGQGGTAVHPMAVSLNGISYNATSLGGSDLATSNWSEAMYVDNRIWSNAECSVLEVDIGCWSGCWPLSAWC
jgi:amino acid transporter